MHIQGRGYVIILSFLIIIIVIEKRPTLTLRLVTWKVATFDLDINNFTSKLLY